MAYTPNTGILFEQYIATQPGSRGTKPIARYGAPRVDAIGAGCASNDVGMAMFQDWFPLIGGGSGYQAGQWTVTTTGTGAAVAQASTPGGGVLMTCGSTTTFNTNLQSLQTLNLIDGALYSVSARFQVSSITAMGLDIGFGSSAVNPQTTDYTNGVNLRMTNGGALLTGRVRGASGTSAATGTLKTLVAATEVMAGFNFQYSATVGNCSGEFWTQDNTNGKVVTSFTSAQLTQLAALTGTMYLNICAVGSAGNPTATITSLCAYNNNSYI